MGNAVGLVCWNGYRSGIRMTETRQEEMRGQVIAFHEDHPEVWNLFCGFILITQSMLYLKEYDGRLMLAAMEPTASN